MRTGAVGPSPTEPCVQEAQCRPWGPSTPPAGAGRGVRPQGGWLPVPGRHLQGHRSVRVLHGGIQHRWVGKGGPRGAQAGQPMLGCLRRTASAPPPRPRCESALATTAAPHPAPRAFRRAAATGQDGPQGLRNLAGHCQHAGAEHPDGAPPPHANRRLRPGTPGCGAREGSAPWVEACRGMRRQQGKAAPVSPLIPRPFPSSTFPFSTTPTPDRPPTTATTITVTQRR